MTKEKKIKQFQAKLAEYEKSWLLRWKPTAVLSTKALFRNWSILGWWFCAKRNYLITKLEALSTLISLEP